MTVKPLDRSSGMTDEPLDWYSGMTVEPLDWYSGMTVEPLDWYSGMTVEPLRLSSVFIQCPTLYVLNWFELIDRTSQLSGIEPLVN